ncbi:MAG TPA: type I 3-dehydroquinate dehydratase [Dehalococcoidales bacterium]|nr:type I 3-dehydroquinate dehydratase [Dehalococcoidales bacterium]
MAGDRPKICATVTGHDPAAVKSVAALVDLFEVRIDIIGGQWPEVIKYLKKPWIACNRRPEEGGQWKGSEPDRIGELRRALKLGAAVIDIELAAPGIGGIIKEIKGRAECLVSHHDLEVTPALEKMYNIVKDQLAAGADICKVVTTARSFADNLAVLRLITAFPGQRVVAFAMGSGGYASRVLCPLVGGYLTYASVTAGRESAAGQITAADLRKIYGMLGK